MIMRIDWQVVTELGLGVLRARGADTLSFLQGQLSNDVTRLQAGSLQLSGYHTPQGRAIALLRLTPLAPDDVLAVLPRELVPAVLTRLRRYVLRAKVQLTDETAQWQILGYAGTPSALPAQALALPYDSSRQLVLIPRIAAAAPWAPPAATIAGSRDDWAACEVAAGLPQVYLPTSEAFVAQMLNLDVVGGISLDKGCYTGQEIIARAHYRGQVKRRLQRFESATPCRLAPGLGGVLADGRSFKVVEAAALADGRCAFLAVTHPAPYPDTATAELQEPELAAGAETQTLINARQLPLPYALP